MADKRYKLFSSATQEWRDLEQCLPFFSGKASSFAHTSVCDATVRVHLTALVSLSHGAEVHTLVLHVSIDLRTGVPLSELNALHVPLHSFLYDFKQGLVLWETAGTSLLLGRGYILIFLNPSTLGMWGHMLFLRGRNREGGGALGKAQLLIPTLCG